MKTLRDPDRDRVRMTPVDATVADLSRIARPPRSALRGLSRVAPHELTVYRVRARLRRTVAGVDGDVHLMLADPDDAARTMVAEIPSPFLAVGSGFETAFRSEREALRRGRIRRDALLEVTGVGFFDVETHDRAGARRTNGFELHPVIALHFLADAGRPRPEK